MEIDLPKTENGTRLRNLVLPVQIYNMFLNIAEKNTLANRETCGILCGKLEADRLYLTTMVIPKQTGTSDSCTTMNEEELFEVQDKEDLMTMGWIHTHPTQSCFMSSVDLHTHCMFQIMLPEAIAIVLSPKHIPRHGIFRLTDPPGLEVITSCAASEMFHPHPDLPLYCQADKAGVGHVVPVNEPCRQRAIKFTHYVLEDWNQPRAATSMASSAPGTCTNDDTFDVDTFLRTQATAFHQDIEIERILGCVKHNPIEILELPPSVYLTGTLDPKHIKLQYRKKSLLTHPDKTTNPSAAAAFELLKHAEHTLTADPEQTAALLDMLREARTTVLRALKIGSADPKAGSAETIVAIRMELRRMIRDIENREVIKNRNEVEFKRREEDRLAEAKKRKADEDKAWEATRDERVQSWRSFVKGGPKKKAKKDDGVVPGMPGTHRK
ncbi:hypothetical protein SeLEV6574_g06738 [Synchytrium endobioticum]|uniref:MPN domain-containing protein n=1 Tax=Synchytrium endobioticum TaxID=286115 RepID=A0A507CKR9_9FUNG|nr:hypothetical protein SeLEV6574_g06738 [Synchytrium endobioticum]